MENTISRILVTKNYFVVTKDTATHIVNKFQVDNQFYNCFYVEERKARHMRPISIRDNILRLKNEIPDVVILVLSLQEDDIRLISSKPRVPREKKPKTPPKPVTVQNENRSNDKPNRPIISIRPISVPES